MKNFLILFLTTIIFTGANASGFSFSTGIGKETITAPRNFSVDLRQIGLAYRFPSNLFVGTTIQHGAPNSSSVSKENRYEVFSGYMTRIDRFAPYIQLAIGRRDFESTSNVDYNYYAVTVGSRYILTDRIFANMRYRYRNNLEKSYAWRSNLYGLGLGYQITPNVAAELGYAYTSGDYKSDQWGLFLTKRF